MRTMCQGQIRHGKPYYNLRNLLQKHLGKVNISLNALSTNNPTKKERKVRVKSLERVGDVTAGVFSCMMEE